MNLILRFSWVVILFLGPVLGNLTPDDHVQISFEEASPVTAESTVAACLGAPQTTRNVRIQEFTTKFGTTFVRRVVSEDFGGCLADLGTTLPAGSFLSCSMETEKAGLKMFSFMEAGGICTGYPYGITMEQQSCTGSGTTVFYTTLDTTARAHRLSGTAPLPALNRLSRSAPLPALKRTAMKRIETMSTDNIVDDDEFSGIEGKGLSSSQAYKELELLNRCQCRSYCSSDPSCNAYSVREQAPNSFICSLANEDVYTNTPTSMGNSYYAVRADLVVDELAFDNLIYRRLADDANGFLGHKAACEAVPGFRLVAPRFQEQMPILLELCLGHPPSPPSQDCNNATQVGWFFVDMEKGITEPLIRNVLPVSQTNFLNSTIMINDNINTHNVFIYAKELQLHDETPDRLNTKPVCQANVYGVNW